MRRTASEENRRCLLPRRVIDIAAAHQVLLERRRYVNYSARQQTSSILLRGGARMRAEPPPGPHAPPQLGSVERGRDLGEHLQVLVDGRRARRPSCPRRRGSHRPRASSRRERRTRSTRLPSSALAPSRLWRDRARPRVAACATTRAAVSNSASGAAHLGGTTRSREPAHSPVGSSRTASDPDRDRTLHRQRRDPGPDQGVGGAAVRDAGSVHNRRSSPICSSRLRPRLSKSFPRPSYSTRFQPTPTPRRSRPRESRSTSAACFATNAVCRWAGLAHSSPAPDPSKPQGARRGRNGSWNVVAAV